MNRSGPKFTVALTFQSLVVPFQVAETILLSSQITHCHSNISKLVLSSFLNCTCSQSSNLTLTDISSDILLSHG